MRNIKRLNWRLVWGLFSVPFLLIFFQNCQGVSQNVFEESSSLDILSEDLAIDSFLAAKTNLAFGESSILTWNVRNSSTLTLNPGNINVTGLSSYSVTPTTTTVYTLVAQNASKSTMSFLTLTVNPQPVAPSISAFSASVVSISAGQISRLNWSVSNALSLKVNPGNLDVTGLTSVAVTPLESTTYTLTATNANGAASGTTMITVTPAIANLPSISSLTAANSSINQGQETTLNWSVTGAEMVHLYPGEINVTGLTSFKVSPKSSMNYSLVAGNTIGSVSKTVLLTVIPSAPSIASFTANSNLISAGQTSSLSWGVSGAQALRLDPGAIDVTGQSSMIVTPTATTTYTLTASNPGGSSVRNVMVTVMPGATTGKILEVGPGKTFASLSAAAASNTLTAGDTILVYHSSTAYGSTRLTRPGTAANKITIRGVPSALGERPIISGGANTIEAAANHYLIENLDIRGGTSRCFFHKANDITLKNSIIRNCPAHGILSADEGSGNLTIDAVEVTASGSGTYEHPVYVTTDQKNFPGSVVRIKYSYIHDNLGGNAIKSRAERNEIYYNWIETSLYRAIELIGPDSDVSSVTPRLKREDSDIVGNVIRQANSQPLIRIGGDKPNSDTQGRYRFVNNTIIMSSAANTTTFQIYLGVESVEMHNNVFYRSSGAPKILDESGAIWVSGRQVSGSNNWASNGATNLPSEWSGTVQGADPGFMNFSVLDFRLTATSVLLNGGNINPMSKVNYVFPSPLLLPAEVPAGRAVGYGGIRSRSSSAVISIGAFER